MAEKIEISTKIKKILKYNHWTQTQLAKELNIIPSRLNHWLWDKNNTKSEWLVDKINELYDNLFLETK